MSAEYWPLPDHVAQCAKPPESISIAEWVERHRILPQGSAESGPKRISRTPFNRAIYEWFADPEVNEITIQKPAQMGVTDVATDLILWISENDPAPTALFLADQDTARKIMKFRIAPALAAFGKVKISKDNRDKDITKFECSLPNGFYLMVSWGSSISQTASMAFKYVICDEINKPGYEANKEEGSSLGRIRERMETYADSKFIKFSTPTTDTGRVTKELELADVVYDYQIACPYCGGMQCVSFKQVVWQGGSAATRKQVEETARYKCLHCENLLTTAEKNKAAELGQFIPRKNVDNPRHIGLQLHRLVSLFKGGRLDEMTWRWIQAQKDGPGEVQNVINSVFGEPWVERISGNQAETEAKLQLCVRDYGKGETPAAAVALTCGIDVQQTGFWYRIRAWAPDLTSWGIDEGFLPTWEDVEALLYSDHSGRKIWRALIDTGGGKEEGAIVSRTEEVYEFIRKNMGRGVQLFGSKGSSRSMPTKLKIGNPIEKTPSGKPIPGGLRIVQINTQSFKDAFWWRVEKAEVEEPGAIYLHRDTPDYYHKQITAEEKRRTKTGAVEWVAIRKDNHLLDCEVLNLACVDPEFWGGLRPVLANIQAPTATTQKKAEPKPNPYTGGGFGNNPFTGGI